MMAGYVSNVVDVLFNIYRYALIFYFLLSWFPQARQVPLTHYLGVIIEPYLSVFRRFIPPIGILDLSAVVGYFTTYLLQIGVNTVIFWIFELVGKVSG